MRTINKTRKTERRHIAIVVPMKAGYHDDLLRGIIAFARQQRRWHIRYATYYRDVRELFHGWRPDGILAALDVAELAETLSTAGCPIVNVSYVNPTIRLPRVGVDERQAGRMAAEYFLQRGFRQFAFVGHPGVGFSDDRFGGYAEVLREANCSCHSFETVKAHTFQNIKENKLRRWIRSLPTPVAIFACNDDLALMIAEVCLQIGLPIPEAAALLGVDNADVICELASPPLSSIDTVPQRIGFEAASLLDRLMNGEAAPREPVLLPPVRVVTRQSTDVVAVADREVARALRFILNNAGRPIGVSDLLEHMPVSRRVLERRFHNALGRGPWQEIRRVRIERAKELLAQMDVTMSAVAEDCGFASHQRFCAVFHEETGMTPTEYRRCLRMDHR